MPTGLKRYSGHDYLHFLTCSCYHRQPWLANPQRRDLFLQVLEDARHRYQFVVVGYVVMPDHIHLLLSEPERGTPSTVMQVVKQRFARQVLDAVRNPTPSASSGQALAKCARAAHPEHVWQKRLYDFHVWSERKRVEKLRYMHRNPVKEGLVPEPEQWPWSSYRSYAYQEAGVVKVNEWPKAEVRRRPAA
jgi:putative transposase